MVYAKINWTGKPVRLMTLYNYPSTKTIENSWKYYQKTSITLRNSKEGAKVQLLPGFPLIIRGEAEPSGPVIDLHMSPYPYDAVIHSAYAPFLFMAALNEKVKVI